MTLVVIFVALIVLAVWPSAETREKMRTLDYIWAQLEEDKED